jgi:hypothetical protein
MGVKGMALWAIPFLFPGILKLEFLGPNRPVERKAWKSFGGLKSNLTMEVKGP